MWANEGIVVFDGGMMNEMESEFQEAGCFPKVAVIKEQWIRLLIVLGAQILEEYVAY